MSEAGASRAYPRVVPSQSGAESWPKPSHYRRVDLRSSGWKVGSQVVEQVSDVVDCDFRYGCFVSGEIFTIALLTFPAKRA